MNILQLISGTGVNGAIRHCSDLTSELAVRGHRVILGHKPGAWIASQPYPDGVELVEVSLRRRPAELKRVAALLREKQIDLIHTHNSSGHFFGALLSLFWKFPRVGTSHGTFFQPHWRLCDRIIAPSEATARYQHRVNFMPRRRIDVIPNFINPSRLEARRDRAAVRAELGIAEDGFLILTVGEVFHRKNQELLVRAVPAMVAAGMQPLVLLVGKTHDGYRKLLESRMHSLGIADRVRLAGQRSDIPDLLHAADLFCLPSRSEVLPIALLESMGQGLPIVATAVGGVAELVRDGQDGLITRSGDVAGLAAAVIRLWREPALRRAMSESGRSRVAGNYSPDACLPASEECYRRACAQRSRGAVAR